MRKGRRPSRLDARLAALATSSLPDRLRQGGAAVVQEPIRSTKP
jgi:hypothetical protein